MEFECQAERIIRKFGGIKRFRETLETTHDIKITRAVIYQWYSPVSKHGQGQGGLIPPRFFSEILQAARLDGILLNVEDLDPRVRPLPSTRKRRIRSDMEALDD